MPLESIPTDSRKTRELRVLRRKRAIWRNSATEISTELVGLISDTSLTNRPPRVELETISNQLLEFRRQLREADTQILDLLDDDDEIDRDIDEAEEFDRRIGAAIAAIMANREHPDTSTSHNGSGCATPTNLQQTPAAGHATSSEPELRPDGRTGPPNSPAECPPAIAPFYRPIRESELAPPTFDGDRLKYRPFITRFDSYVSRLYGITPIERLIVLQKYLKGEPLDLVCALELTDSNYEVARQVLEDNYSLVSAEKFRLLREIQTLQRITRPYDLPGLRRMISLVQTNVAVLAANGVPLSQYAVSLFTSISASLPPRMRQDFAEARELDRRLYVVRPDDSEEADNSTTPSPMQTNDPVTETNKLIAFVRKRIQQLEATEHAESAERAPPGRNFVNKASAGQRRLVSTVAATTVRPPQRSAFRSKQCLFCNDKSHNSSRCPADIPIGRRHEILNTRKRCPKCFRDIHALPTECRGPRSPCLKCKSPEHYTSMHTEEKSSTAAAAAVVFSVSTPLMTNALLWTMCAYVTNHGLKIPVRVFLDNGSSVTFVAPALRKLLREQPVGANDLSIQAFAGHHSRRAVPIYKLRLAGPKGEPEIELLAHEYEFGVDPSNTCSRALSTAVQAFDKRFPLADRSYVDEWEPSAPAILIGMNQINKFLIAAAPENVIDGVTAHPTRFGWVLGGATPANRQRTTNEITASYAVCCAASVAAVAERLSQPARDLRVLWNMESIGIVDQPTTTSNLSADEQNALQQFHDGLSYNGRRYTVRLPKRSTIDQMPSNLALATRRLERRLTQLAKDPAKFRRYNDELMRFVTDGCAVEVVPTGSTGAAKPTTCSRTTYYMPHHEVVNAAGKWRIVFDCSASERGASSLNQHLLQGPNLNADIAALLLRFRASPVAVTADIAKAYMKIEVHDDDRPLFRFLWRGPDDTETRTFQMTRVTWGATPSAFLLAATVREHLRRAGPEAEQLATYMYADDFVYSGRSENEAKEFVDRLRHVLAGAGMELAKWKSNSNEVIEHLRATGVPSEGFDTRAAGLFKVLGIAWDTQFDMFHFATPDLRARIEPEKPVSKRTALSIIAAVYDPLGWLLPFTLRGKLMIQQIWTTDMSWNDFIPETVHRDLVEWVLDLSILRDHRIPRRFSLRRETAVSHHLHLFADASQKAYATAAYIEYRYADRTSEFALVMCRSRIAPRDPQTIPRLELLAALISVRLRVFLTDRLGVEFAGVRHYTDSKIAYHWATSARPGAWRPFVSNRVTEIQCHSVPTEWYHVQGTSNISDLATRGVSAETLVTCTDWWFGPAWLRSPLAEQPISQPRTESSSFEQVSNEARRIAAPAVAAMPLIDLERHSTAGRVMRIMVNVLRFTHALRRQPLPSLRELHRRTEAYIIRTCQQQLFSEEIAAVRAGRRVPSSSKLAAFQLFLDDHGVLRARTRLTNCLYLTFDEMNPMVIPGESRLARLLIIDAHRVNAHFGVNTILSQLRKRFWITRARQIVKSILHGCVVCRRRQGRGASQVEAPLPAFRVELRAPFAAAGLDFCGPFATRLKEGHHKSYIAVFTCGATRAIHLELVPSMTAPQTVLALRRFFAIYPACTHLVSDNGRSFTKAATELKRLFNSVNDPEVREVLRSRVVEWSFVCPRAPWHNGFVERMVKITKDCLYRTLGRSLIGFEELRTILCELSAVINNRPITYEDSSDPDSPGPLTPAHFLRGGPNVAPLAELTPIDRLHSDELATAEQLRRGLASRTTYFRSLSARWHREYLTLLRSANLTRGTPAASLAVGDVCLLKDDNLPRIKWDLVRIIDSHPGRDGNVRTYSVRFANGRTSRRAAQLLYPLEVISRVPPSSGEERTFPPPASPAT